MEDAWLTETYFDWLKSEAFSVESERREYEGILRVLHDIPFYWTIWSDENRAGDALSFRQSDFLGFQTDLDRLDQKWLAQWASATPSVLEVMLGMARRWAFYYENSVAYFFGVMFINMGFTSYPGKILNSRTKEVIRLRVDNWMSRQFTKDGHGSPFPVSAALDIVDMTKLDIWSQMNAYSAEHFQ